MSGCEQIQSRLSEYLDDSLAAEEQTEVSAHLERCAACRGLLRDLERLRSTARQLGPMPPPDHIWLEVAGQIHLRNKGPASAVVSDGKPAARHPAWQWIGLAAALVIITLGAYVVTRIQRSNAGSETAGNLGGAAAVQLVEQELRQAERHYENAIAQLEAIAKSNEGTLDPAVASTLQRNLTTIDQAITESRAALTTNPDSAPARDSLFEALRRKVSVLEATVSLINEMRKGDQAGAARVTAGLGRKG